jgi:long-chain acyl-CoA synthetase
MNLSELLSHSAQHAGSRLAVTGSARATYGQTETLAARFASLLAANRIGPGDRVLVHLPNSLAFIVAYYGALKTGAVVVPATAMLRPAELQRMAADVGVRGVVRADGSDGSWAGLADITVPADGGIDELVAQLPNAVARPVDRSADDLAVLVYTSGTTGHPKGAALTHANLISNATAVAGHLGYRSDDTLLMAIPGSHVMGQSLILNPAMSVGASVLPQPRFAPDVALRLMAAHGVTVLAGVPTLLLGLLAAYKAGGQPRPPLRLAAVGGAASPDPLLHEFAEVFGCEVGEGYGLSECSGIATATAIGAPRKPGTVGRPIRGVEIRIVAAEGPVAIGRRGEVEIRGHNVMAGYFGHEQASAEVMRLDGWMATGDIGCLDEDGDLFILDRAKDVIIRNGFNVYPREVEEALLQHPHVVEAAVVGVADQLHGEEIAAVIVTDGSAPDTEELRAFARERLAPYKYPRLIKYVDALPKGPTGKLLRRQARAMLDDDDDAGAHPH